MRTPTYHRILPIGEFLTYPEIPQGKVIFTNQVHSNEIIEYTGNDISNVSVDGIMASYENLQDISLGIKTADCMPIILLGKNHVVFLHAGWRGLADGILKHELIGKTRPFYAFIGPSIQQQSFEVDSDFKQHFSDTNFHENAGKLYFNLQKEACDQIYQSYNGIKVIYCNEDTMKNKNLHSYRENKTQHRNWNIFTL